MKNFRRLFFFVKCLDWFGCHIPAIAWHVRVWINFLQNYLPGFPKFSKCREPLTLKETAPAIMSWVLNGSLIPLTFKAVVNLCFMIICHCSLSLIVLTHSTLQSILPLGHGISQSDTSFFLVMVQSHCKTMDINWQACWNPLEDACSRDIESAGSVDNIIDPRRTFYTT